MAPPLLVVVQLSNFESLMVVEEPLTVIVEPPAGLLLSLNTELMIVYGEPLVKMPPVW